MPLVRIDVCKSATTELIQTVGDAVYAAMVEIADVPVNDRFQIVTRHEPDELMFPSEGYLEATYSKDLIIIQVLWVAGRTTATKQNFYRRVVDDIHAKQKIRKEDIIIVLSDNARVDWSFGGGVMQYAPK